MVSHLSVYNLFLILADALAPSSPEVVVGDYEGAFLKMFLTLVALLVAIFCAAWALKKLAAGRFMQLNMSKNIKIIEKRAISSKTMVYLLEFEGKRVLIAESQLEVKRLYSSEQR
jgi:flagellar biogenesis protein FliO